MKIDTLNLHNTINKIDELRNKLNKEIDKASIILNDNYDFSVQYKNTNKALQQLEITNYELNKKVNNLLNKYYDL